jgi:hypothetical protein
MLAITQIWLVLQRSLLSQYYYVEAINRQFEYEPVAQRSVGVFITPSHYSKLVTMWNKQ